MPWRIKKFPPHLYYIHVLVEGVTLKNRCIICEKEKMAYHERKGLLTKMVVDDCIWIGNRANEFCGWGRSGRRREPDTDCCA